LRMHWPARRPPRVKRCRRWATGSNLQNTTLYPASADRTAMPQAASALAADPRLGPYALMLFMAVLFNVLFCYRYFRRAKFRKAAEKSSV